MTGQCPVMKYSHGLMMAILHDRVQIAAAVNATVIGIDDAPRGYAEFDQGAAKTYVIDPHGVTSKASEPRCREGGPSSGGCRLLW